MGNFKVRVRKKPRFVIADKCTSCGDCATACPSPGGNEFDVALSTRKAIYIPFPQAVPNTYTLDPDSCLNAKLESPGGWVTDLERLNQRMHNKQLVADNRAAIIGGRNIGDEYLGLNPTFHFRDLDVLGIGPVARQASAIFDRFWNSEWVMPVSALKKSVTNEELARMRAELTKRVREEPKLAGLPAAPRDWSGEFDAIANDLSVGTSTILTDSPDEDAVTHHMPDAIVGLIGSATREVMITNAYLIPGQKAVDGLKAMKDRGVRLRILTNSLASHDVPAVNSHQLPRSQFHLDWRESR